MTIMRQPIHDQQPLLPTSQPAKKIKLLTSTITSQNTTITLLLSILLGLKLYPIQLILTTQLIICIRFLCKIKESKAKQTHLNILLIIEFILTLAYFIAAITILVIILTRYPFDTFVAILIVVIVFYLVPRVAVLGFVWGRKNL